MSRSFVFRGLAVAVLCFAFATPAFAEDAPSTCPVMSDAHKLVEQRKAEKFETNLVQKVERSSAKLDKSIDSAVDRLTKRYAATTRSAIVAANRRPTGGTDKEKVQTDFKNAIQPTVVDFQSKTKEIFDTYRPLARDPFKSTVTDPLAEAKADLHSVVQAALETFNASCDSDYKEASIDLALTLRDAQKDYNTVSREALSLFTKQLTDLQTKLRVDVEKLGTTLKADIKTATKNRDTALKALRTHVAGDAATPTQP